MSYCTPLDTDQITLVSKLFKHVVVPVLAAEHVEEDGRAGAVLDIRDPNHNMQLYLRAGHASEADFKRCSRSAAAQNKALHERLTICSSWMVYDIPAGLYPGGIRTMYDDRFAISGFTWQRDQAGSLWLAEQLGRIDARKAMRIASISRERTSYQRLTQKFDAQRKIHTDSAAA